MLLFMGKDPRYWMGVVVAGAVGMTLVSLKPDAYEEHRQQVIDVFDLPEDVEFLAFRSGWQRYGGEYVGATIQLTPGQYERFLQTAESADGMAWVPLDRKDIPLDAQTEPGWNRWWDGDMSIIVDLNTSPHGARTRALERALKREQYKAIQWVHWDHVHGNGADEDLSVWKAGKHLSMCWAYGEQDGKKAVRTCTAYPPTQWSPDLCVRALLDTENKRLFVHIK